MHALTSVAAAAILAYTANAQAAYEVAGNWYTNQVDAIQYTNFGSSGNYNQVTNMDSTSGTCSSTPVGYSGSTAPLDGPVSVHVRGPLALSQFAFYTPSSASKAKRDGVEAHGAPAKRHAHGHAHAHARMHAAEEKRQVGAWVTATIDGQVVSWVNEWSGEPTTAPAPEPPAATETAAPAAPADSSSAGSSSGKTGGSLADWVANIVADHNKGKTPVGSSSGPYTRGAYYNAQSQTASGLTFLNHNGGQGSGVFDYVFGNSLSYASSDASSGSASPEILADMTLPSDTELVILTDQNCDGGACGYTRPGGVAKQGFGGSDKIFVFEFTMPLDGNTGFNGDMPAIWLLNAQIPLTLQYGKPECSCWTTGCGELDIVEVLDSGDTRCKSTLHGNISGGDSAYIQRPTDAPMQLAVVMSDSTATIKVLDGSFDFAQGLSQADVDSFSSSQSLISNIASSIFNLS